MSNSTSLRNRGDRLADTFRIEKARVQDTGLICEIDRNQIGSSRRRDYLSKAVRDGQCLLARMDGKCVGFAVVDEAFYEQSFIWLLVVDPSYRRRGIASALIRFIESICPTEKLFTSTNQSNLAMQRLMDKLGFVKSGYIENLDEADPEIVYFRRIKKKP